MYKNKKKDDVPEFPEYDMLAAEPERDFSGFLVPSSDANLGVMSPGLAYSSTPVPFGSPSSAPSSAPGSAPGSAPISAPGSAPISAPGSTSVPVPFGSPGYSTNPLACQYHGYREPSCTRCKNAREALDIMQRMQLQPPGFIPPEARTFEPPIPNSAGLSFSPLVSTELKPVKKTLFEEDSDDEMNGGRRKYRKSSKKLKRKSSKKLKKSKRKSSKKARKS